MSQTRTKMVRFAAVVLYSSLAAAQRTSPAVAPEYDYLNGPPPQPVSALLVCDIDSAGTPWCAWVASGDSAQLSSWIPMGGTSWSSLAVVNMGYGPTGGFTFTLLARGTDNYIWYRQFVTTFAHDMHMVFKGDWQHVDDFGRTYDGLSAIAAWPRWNEPAWVTNWLEVHLFVRGTDDAVWDDLLWSRLDWPSLGWTNVLGRTYRAPAAAFNRMVGDYGRDTWMSLFAVGTDDSLYFTQSVRSKYWPNPWCPLGHPSSGVVTSAPAATAPRGDLPCSTNVYVRGSDNKLWGRSNSSCSYYGCGTWSDWYPLDGDLTSGPGAIADTTPGASPVEYIVARGTDNALHRYTRNPERGWQRIGFGP